MMGRNIPVLALTTLVAAARLCCAAEPGTITGIIQPASGDSGVSAVSAIERLANKPYAGLFDAKTGRFVVAGLPLGLAYDLVLEYGGSRLEGVDLVVPASDYEEEQPLAAEDVETIRRKALSLNKFEDVVDILTIRGNIQHAAVLLNKVRTKPFVNSAPGEVIWRAELWHFERPESTWVKVQGEQFITLYRERIQKAAYEKKSVAFDARLGGLRPTAQAPRIDLNTVKLPDPKPGVRLLAEDEP